jgi:hypothetical protein
VVVRRFRHRAVKGEVGVGAMELVAGRFPEVGKCCGDLLQSGLVAALGGEIGRRRLDGQAELVAALDVGNRLDRRIGELRRRRALGADEGPCPLARVDDALVTQPRQRIADDRARMRSSN